MFLAGSAAGVTAAIPVAACGTEAPLSWARIRRPNVLLIVTDDQPLHTEWAMPSIVSQIGGQGVRFTNGYVTTPLCAPSRASILSGRYAHNHGLLQNERPGVLDQRSTLPRYLRDAGYRTGMVGKYLNGWDVTHAPPHFDEYAMMQPPKYTGARWNINGKVTRQAAYSTSVVRDHALDFLRRNNDPERPWFLYVTPYASHGPYTPESKYAHLAVPQWKGNPAVAEKNKRDKPKAIQKAHATLAEGRRIRRGQLRTLRSVDAMFAAIRAELIAQKSLNDTLIIFISDNGFCWADHGWTSKSVPYAPSMRVPFYMSWPGGGFGAGRTDDRLVANIDVAPTILDAARVQPSSGPPMDGRSLLRVGARDRLLIEWWKRKGQTTHPPSWAATVTATTQYTEYYDTVIHAGRPTGSGKIVFREHYNLRRDPYQLANQLYKATPETWRRLGVPRLSAQLKADRHRR